MSDITESTNMIVSIEEWNRLKRIEEAAMDAYPYGWLRLYWRPRAPKLEKLRAALYSDLERA